MNVRKVMEWRSLCRRMVAAGLIVPGLLQVAGATDASEATLSQAEVCLMLASPGDFLLQHNFRSFDEDDDGEVDRVEVRPAWRTWSTAEDVVIGAKEVLTLNNPTTRYYHAEFIRGVDLASDPVLITADYTPEGGNFRKKGSGEVGGSSYSFHGLDVEDFAIFRVRGDGSAERALQRLDERRYYDHGVCSEYVNWLYGDRMNYWWNQLPGLDRLLLEALSYPMPQTPDNLADAPESVLVCEWKNGAIARPRVLRIEPLWKRVRENLGSTDARVRAHAERVQERMLGAGWIDASGEVLIDRVETATLPALPPGP